VSFWSSSELGSFDDERGVVPEGIFVESAFVDLDTTVENLSAYLPDTLAITRQLGLVLSARYNDTRVKLRDRLGTQLSGDHGFEHLNSAAAFT